MCSLGYATHAILDVATSYGTFLLWPFIEIRYSWNIISIVDPLFSYWPRMGYFYLGVDWWQHQGARVITEN
jgi:membrane-bound metal-dependent hydrolase YbcI (DUF457 family)